MSDIIQRFIKRLSLYEYIQNKPSIKIIDYLENNNLYNYGKDTMLQTKELSNKWDVPDRRDIILQLYHVSREPKNYLSIMQNGFYINSNLKNKGDGVYLSNHGRYSAFWGNSGQPRYVLICNVLYNSNNIKRYRSEIYSPKYNSEYVIKDTKLIYPIGLLIYNLTFNYRIKSRIFVEHGKFGCKKCDVKNKYGYYKRCDCELTGIDPEDIIN